MRLSSCVSACKRPVAARPLGLMLAIAGALASAGCAERTASLYADPGRYRFYDCEQLAARLSQIEKREQDLQALMARAEQGSGGALVSAVAYRSDYLTAVGERQLVEEAAVERDCEYTRAWRSDSVIR